MSQPKLLYRDFLTDDRIYNLNIGYWQTEIQTLLDKNGIEGESLFQNRNSFGKWIKDGNPIYTFYSHQIQKAIRIIQEDPTEVEDWNEVPLLDAWIDTVTLPTKFSHKLAKELVLSVYLTKSSLYKSLHLISLWLLGQLDSDNLASEVDAPIDDFIKWSRPRKPKQW